MCSGVNFVKFEKKEAHLPGKTKDATVLSCVQGSAEWAAFGVWLILWFKSLDISTILLLFSLSQGPERLRLNISFWNFSDEFESQFLTIYKAV